MIDIQNNRKATNTDPQFEAHRRNATWVSALTGVVLLVIIAAVLQQVIRLGQDRIWVLLIASTVPVIAFLCMFISARGQPHLAGGILIATVLVSALSVTFLFAQNQGIALSAIIVFVTSTIAFYTLPQPWVSRVIMLAVVVGCLNIVFDVYLPNLGLPNDPRYTNTIGALVSIIYLAILLRRFDQFPLRTKLIVAFILISLLPAILLGLQSTAIARTNLIQQTNADLLETARTAGTNIDTVLEVELDTIRTEAQIADLADYLKLSPAVRPGSREEQRAYAALLALQQRNFGFISSYGLLDKNGMDVLDTFPDDIGVNKADRDYFQSAVAGKVPYISPVQISQTTLAPSFYFSTPVLDQNGNVLGVLRSRYNAEYLQNLLRESAQSEQERYAVLVDNETFVRLADTGDPFLIFKALGNLNETEVKNLQSQLRLRRGTPAQVTAPEPQVIEGIRNLDEQPFFTAPSITFGGENTYASGVKLTNTNWSVIVRQSEQSVLVPVERQTRAIVIVSLLVIALAAGAGFVASQILARPLIQLSTAASEIAGGNLSVRAVSETKDEVGELANAFNHMTSQLQDSLGSLERRVAERTADLEMARLLSERRAQELQAISEISNLISSEQQLENLLTLITRLVSERFDFYHVGIFFIDTTRQYAVLQAANSEGGQKMLARGHRLEVGHTGIVGNVANTGEARIALDVGADATYFDNPDLPMTRSEMALPLNVHGETIGVLDVQSIRPGAFTENDTKTLSILADQIAIAISNARLFGQNQQALEELQSLYNTYLRQEWKTFIQNRQHIGYAQSLISGRPLDTPVDSEEVQHALVDGRVVVLKGSDSSLPTIAVPVKLRGQTIGVLHIKAPMKDRVWNQDEINFAQAISDRLALALDNARLLFVSQRQTAKEQKIGEVTAKIGASINMRNVLQTAVEELGRALPGSEVMIQFQKNQNGSSPE